MKAVALLSSGIDSPVAVYLMLRKGIEITPIHFRQDPVKEEKVLEILEVLRRYGKLNDPIVVDFSEEHVLAFEKLKELGKGRYTCVLCKWLMIRKACRISHKIGASAIITGDSLGQVASQTLDNLMAVSTASDLPILRPLIGFDKEEIVRIAREIGTFDISSREEPTCPFTPKYPIIRASPAEFLKILKEMDVLSI
ncbi:7-cyano-7-deazaguanine synthase [Thermococcus stetteri]|uniref:7-cyano-7-deazaguanine synthase n=1 Tax=Thermococcus stetteri TaxID=49900 RepID=UPI001AE70700|nr:7-cyano-7-deazaguanine synthase [Thermococcus stetteri]MBP1910770.1 thiamine biosynthesis protein ThiI [Thermococcus stetteri]